MASKRVFITLPTELVVRVKEYNLTHPETPISYSGICRKGLEDFMKLV
jgi:hypothetical protein